MNVSKNLIEKLSIQLVICGLMLLMYGCDRDPKIQDMVTWTGPIDPDIVAANTQFGFNLFNEIHQNDQENNIFGSCYD